WEAESRGRDHRCWGYVLQDGAAAICMRKSSPRQVAEGWLHWLVDVECGCNGAHEQVHAGVGSTRPRPQPLVYDYRGLDGQVLHQTVRRFPKRFSQRRPAPSAPDGFAWNLRGVQTVLYCWPELAAADPDEWVFVAEGEKDVDRLRALGLVATCNP